MVSTARVFELFVHFQCYFVQGDHNFFLVLFLFSRPAFRLGPAWAPKATVGNSPSQIDIPKAKPR